MNQDQSGAQEASPEAVGCGIVLVLLFVAGFGYLAWWNATRSRRPYRYTVEQMNRDADQALEDAGGDVHKAAELLDQRAGRR